MSAVSVALRLYGLAGAAVVAWLLLGRGGDAEAVLRRRERLGYWRSSQTEKKQAWLWVHAASVGEVRLACALAAGLRRQGRTERLVLSCNTATGRAVAAGSPFDETHYFPTDWGPCLRRVLGPGAGDGPRAFIAIETEIWPRLLQELAARGIPAAFVNARISDRSYPRYHRLRSLLRATLATVGTVCARDDVSARRFQELGVPQAAITVTGDLKFDGLSAEQVDETPLAFGAAAPFDGAKLVLAASTHTGEEEVALSAFRTLRDSEPGARLVLVPRHPERADQVQALIQKQGLDYARFSTASQHEGGMGESWQVLLVDVVGQLRSFFRSVPVVFLGGSMVPVGGHNLLEPSAYGCCLASGSELGGVQEQADRLLAADALTVVHDAEDLAAFWHNAVADPGAAASQGERARKVVQEGRGALASTLRALNKILPTSEAAA